MTIISVYGKVDSVDVICRYNEITSAWVVEVPADYEDGVYNCEFWCVSDSGVIGYRTAILWITDGRKTHISFVDAGYEIAYISNSQKIIIDFLLGEEKYLDFMVRHENNEKFYIQSAEYRLIRRDEVEDSGKMIVDHQKMSVRLNPKEMGHYILEVTCKIAAETRKARFFIDVGASLCQF